MNEFEWMSNRSWCSVIVWLILKKWLDWPLKYVNFCQFLQDWWNCPTQGQAWVRTAVQAAAFWTVTVYRPITTRCSDVWRQSSPTTSRRCSTWGVTSIWPGSPSAGRTVLQPQPEIKRKTVTPPHQVNNAFGMEEELSPKHGYTQVPL